MGANKYWREAASIITLTRNKINNNSNGYKMLFQKRNSNSSFMPSNIVFPGGVCHESDFDKKWIDFIESFKIPSDKFTKFQNPSAEVPLLFQGDSNPNLKHIALRITAIRETFEEVGLLLCKSRTNQQNDCTTASFQTNFDVFEWQEKVNKNPSDFFSLCQNLDCYPDVFSLHLWSNWLTPVTKPKRFNTAFFVTFLDTQPDIHIDNGEVTEYMWSTPSEVLESFKNKELVLATPQHYELSKLKVSDNFNDLHKYAKSRSCLGCELMYPIYQKSKNSSIATFPGDIYYPENPNLNENIYKVDLKDKTFEELQKVNEKMHRMIYRTPHDVVYDIKNYASKHHQITPTSKTLPSFQAHL